MLTDRMARLSAEFSAQLMVVVQEASREELAARRQRSPNPLATKANAQTRAAVPAAAPAAPAKRKPGRPRKDAVATVAPARPAPPPPKREVSSAMISAATRYFGERGNKGATATQLASFLAEQGLVSDADVITELTTRGAIRDAGFRRSTGVGNKTSAVFVKN